MRAGWNWPGSCWPTSTRGGRAGGAAVPADRPGWRPGPASCPGSAAGGRRRRGDGGGCQGRVPAGGTRRSGRSSRGRARWRRAGDGGSRPGPARTRELLDNVRFLAGYRRGLVISAGLLPVVLDAARGQATIGSVERALAGAVPGSAGPPGGAAPAVDGPVAGGSAQAARRGHAGAARRGGCVMSGQVLSLDAGQPAELRRRRGRGGGGRRGAGDAAQRPDPPVHRRADFPAGGVGPSGGRDPSAGDDGVSPGLALAGSLTSEQLDRLAERAGHVREVLTGYKSGHPDRAASRRAASGLPGRRSR